jgi:hypothetical protein
VISTPGLLDGEALVLAIFTAGRQCLGRGSEVVRVLVLVHLSCGAEVKMGAWVRHKVEGKTDSGSSAKKLCGYRGSVVCTG